MFRYLLITILFHFHSCYQSLSFFIRLIYVDQSWTICNQFWSVWFSLIEDTNIWIYTTQKSNQIVYKYIWIFLLVFLWNPNIFRYLFGQILRIHLDWVILNIFRYLFWPILWYLLITVKRASMRQQWPTKSISHFHTHLLISDCKMLLS